MKVCGYCNNEYADNEPKCPVCGSTLLKHTAGSSAAQQEYNRIKEELERKRRRTSKILIACVAAVVVMLVTSVIAIVAHFNSPEYKLNKEYNNVLSQAKHEMNDGNYEDVYNVLKKIDPSWDDYDKVEALRAQTLRKELNEQIESMEAERDYVGIISLIRSKVDNIDTEPDIKAIFDDTVRDYTDSIIEQVDKCVATGDYDSARAELKTAITVLGESPTLSSKLSDVDTANIRANIDKYLADADYAGVVSYLQNVIDKYPQFSTDLDNNTQKYIEVTIAQADEYLKKPDYSSAISVIKNALRTVGERAALTDKLTEAEDASINASIEGKLASGGYADVVTYLKAVVKEYPRFEPVLTQYTQKYIDDAISKADSFKSQSDFSSAKEVLNKATNLIGKDSKITNKLAEVEKAEVNATVDTYVKQDDYVGLVTYLKPLSNKDSEYQALYNQYCQTLKEKTLTKAETLASMRQFADAIQTIKNVQSVYDCNDFMNKIEEYEEYLPINLADCQIISMSPDLHYNNYFGAGSTKNDTFGNEYRSAFWYHTNDWYADESKCVIYYINRKYANLEVTIAPIECQNFSGYGVVEFYVDDVLIYTSPEIHVTTEPINVNLDLKSGSQLKIVINPEAVYGRWGALVAGTLS